MLTSGTDSSRAIIKHSSFRPSSFAAPILLAAALFGVSANAFELTDTAGKPQRLSGRQRPMGCGQFLGHLVCTVHQGKSPTLPPLPRRAGGKARVVGIALDWDDKVKGHHVHSERPGHAYPLVLGDEKTEKAFGKVKGLPTTIVYDPQGKIAGTRRPARSPGTAAPGDQGREGAVGGKRLYWRASQDERDSNASPVLGFPGAARLRAYPRAQRIEPQCDF